MVDIIAVGGLSTILTKVNKSAYEDFSFSF